MACVEKVRIDRYGNKDMKHIKNAAEDLAGIICNGAINGCALKLDTAVQTALILIAGATMQSRVRVLDGLSQFLQVELFSDLL